MQEKIGCFMIIIWAAIVVAIIYTAIHFILKFW